MFDYNWFSYYARGLRMKFSLINASPYEGLDEREARKSISSFPPLGILYLASVLRERGVEVSVLDQPAKGLTIDETANWVEKEKPDILGFSTFVMCSFLSFSTR